MYDLRAAQALLKSRFIYWEEPAAVLANAITPCRSDADRGENVVFWGPAGHGKSEMSKTFFEGLGVLDKTFVLSFGEDSDESRLLGGLDLYTFEKERRLAYLVEDSFMNFEFVIFEEFFDAPPVVLLALKDILSSGCLRKGKQQFKIRTKMVIICTNRNPNEFGTEADDDSRIALMERFPLVYQMRWPKYDAATYLAMHKVASKGFDELHEIAANITAGMNEGRQIVSPRIAVKAVQRIAAQARLYGRDYYRREDFDVLRFLPPFNRDLKALGAVIDSNYQSFGARLSFFEIKALLARLRTEIGKLQASDVESHLALITDAEMLFKRLKLLKLPPALFEADQALRREFTQLIRGRSHAAETKAS